MPIFPPISGASNVGPLALPAGLQIVLFLVFFAVFGLIIAHKYKTRRKPALDSWIFLAIVFIGLLVSFNEARLPAFWRVLTGSLGVIATQFLTVGFVFGTGWGVYRFKLRSKLYYGYSEVFFGVLSAFMIVRRADLRQLAFSSLLLTQTIALIGAVYIVARGLTNCHEARGNSRVTATDNTRAVPPSRPDVVKM